MQFDHFALRLLQDTDAGIFFQMIDRNRPRLEDFFSGTVARTGTLSDTEQYVTEIMERIAAKSYYPYLLIDLILMEPVGFLDIKNIDWNLPKGELGCFIDASYEGQGLASEAMRLLINQVMGAWGFQKLFLRTSPLNTSAIALAERCGFRQEGLLRKDYKTTSGEVVDLAYYGLIKSDLYRHSAPGHA